MRASSCPRRAAVTAFAVAVTLVVAGCGVQRDSQPRALPREGVPFGLLATSTTSTAPVEPQALEVPVTVFLVNNDTGRLVAVERQVAAPPSVRSALQELLRGPTEQELARGLRSSLTRSTQLLEVEGPEGGVVTVDLTELTGIAGPGLRLALAQVVFTATAAPDVDGVLFEFQGQRTDVPNDAGESTAEPLRRSHFATLDPDAPSTSTTAAATAVTPGQPG